MHKGDLSDCRKMSNCALFYLQNKLSEVEKITIQEK